MKFTLAVERLLEYSITNYNSQLTRFSIDFFKFKYFKKLHLSFFSGGAVLVAGYQKLAIQFPLFSVFH